MMVAFQQTEFAQILGMPGWRFQYGQKKWNLFGKIPFNLGF